MKKRIVGLVLSLVLVFGLIGCGSNAGTGQETNAEGEQEAEADSGNKQDMAGEDLGWAFLYDEEQETDFQPNLNTYDLEQNIRYSFTKDTNLYNDNGSIVGYINSSRGPSVDICAVGDNYVKMVSTVNEERTEFIIKIEDLEDDSEFAGLYSELASNSSESATEYNYEDMAPTAIFRQILENGGMEPTLDLIRERENIDDSDGAMVNVPRENTVEWAEEKLQEFLDSGIKYFDTEGYGFTDYSEHIKLRLGTEKDNPLSEDEIKAFFQSEADIELRKKLNPNLLILDEIGYDENKTYTMDEYVEFFTKILEGMGKAYNAELAQMNPMDSYDGFHIERALGITDFSSENIESVMNYMEYGRDGYGGITEFCVLKGTNEEGTETINIIVKVDHSQRITE